MHQRTTTSAGDASRVEYVWGARTPELFVVVQDLYLTETAELADVVLPDAGWGEKTGTFTNATRTVHLSEKAVEPPGQAHAADDAKRRSTGELVANAPPFRANASGARRPTGSACRR